MFKLNDKVFSMCFGEGVVVMVLEGVEYPIVVHFHENELPIEETFTISGIFLSPNNDPNMSIKLI